MSVRNDPAIHQIVEAQVDRSPEAPAAFFGVERISYRELDRRANRFARYLRRVGVRPEEGVGLCLHRSFEMLAAVLGVLKAGATYAPLDPAYPKERLAFMLEDAAPRVLATHSSLLGSLPDAVGVERVLMDAEADRIDRESDERLEDAASDDRLIYLTYTSGSTGRPKGIEMTQRPLRNLLNWMFRTTRLPEGARTLQFSSLSFDVSFQDLFSTLGSGGALVLLSEAQRNDIAGLWQVILAQGVHRIFLPAVALQQLAEAFQPEAHSSAQLLQVISSGEQLLVTPAIRAMFQSLPGCRLLNQYGPSETHVVTELALPDAPEEWPARPSIGRPIDHTRIHLLDPDRRPVPNGEPGELYISGASLARGYRNRPETTRERFVPNPFESDPGPRLYRTGDRARSLPDGAIEFLGRTDHQVKVRGYRIEPAEIEAALSGHPAVREAAVVALECGTPEAYLAAYLAVDRDQALTVTGWRAFLAERLPDYMIPAAFVLLDRLPLNANGKVDRSALPKPDHQRPDLSVDYAPPANALERTIQEVWRQVLSIERIGVNDSFFDLGGHSLRMAQVQSLLQEKTGIAVALTDLFRRPTIRTLARLLEDATQLKPISDVALERARRQREAFAGRRPVAPYRKP